MRWQHKSRLLHTPSAANVHGSKEHFHSSSSLTTKLSLHKQDSQKKGYLAYYENNCVFLQLNILLLSLRHKYQQITITIIFYYKLS